MGFWDGISPAVPDPWECPNPGITGMSLPTAVGWDLRTLPNPEHSRALGIGSGIPGIMEFMDMAAPGIALSPGILIYPFGY